MGFLWSDIEIKCQSDSFRYYNDLIWYTYSLLGMVPLLLLTMYKWVRMLGFLIYYFQIKKPIVEKGKREWDDIVTLPLICYGPVYYLVDAVISLFDGSFLTPCRFALWYHHIIAVVILPHLFKKKSIFWYETAVWLTHSFVVYNSEYGINNYFYALFVVYFNVQLYKQDYDCYKYLGKYFPLLYYSFFMILFHDCHLPLPYL